LKTINPPERAISSPSELKKGVRFLKKNRHHVRPRSRGGGNGSDNIIRKEVREHAAYHELFGNMTVEEIIICILLEWTTPEWRQKYTHRLVDRLERIENQIFPETRE
jgi:hypothetical protein